MRAAHLSLSVVLALCAVTLAGCPDDRAPLEPPGAPTGLTATPANSAVALSWPAVSNATSYKVYSSTSSGLLATKGTAVATVTVGTAYNHTTANGTERFYQVTAVNAAGESAGSVEASATPVGTLPPAAPAGVAATAGNESVTLTWTSVPSATSYNVYRGTAPGVTTAGTKFTGVTSPHGQGSLNNGEAYYFIVTAVNGYGESVASSEVTATPVAVKPYIYATALMLPDSGSGYLDPYTVDVCTDPDCTTSVPNATVTIGGTALAYDAYNGNYTGSPTSSIAGASLTLRVVIPSGSLVASGTYTATGTMYAAAPTMMNPTSSTEWPVSSAHTVNWTAGSPASASSAYAVIVYGAGLEVAVEVPIGTQSYTIPANAATPGTYLAVVGIGPAGFANDTGGIAIPNTQAGSTFSIAATSEWVRFTYQ